jgi:glycosyltransferase involved in cell wall biosynthesis
MRILTIADVAPDPHAGVSGTVWNTNAALRKLGHQVDSLWAADLGRRIKHGNLHYVFELPRAIERAVREAGAYDVVQVSQPHGYRAVSIAHRKGALFVHRSHGLEPRVAEELGKWRRDARPITRRTMSALITPALARHVTLTANRADGHLVLCNDDARYLAERFGVDPNRIAVAAPAAHEALTNDDPPPMTAERLRRVLYVSQFAPFKAPEIVAEVMRALAPTHELTWVCSRAHHDAVRQLVGAPVALLDWMPADELKRVYDRHGVFLFPSYAEGFGKVFLEAMSRGVCTIASDTSGARDVIDHGRDGVLVPVGDARAITDAVRAIDLQRAIHMSAAAVAKARQYTWERAARQSIAFFESLR